MAEMEAFSLIFKVCLCDPMLKSSYKRGWFVLQDPVDLTHDFVRQLGYHIERSNTTMDLFDL